MSELMKKPLTKIEIDGKSFSIPKHQKSVLLRLVKGMAEVSENPFTELEKSFPPYAISLRAAREKAGLSQTALAKQIKTDRSNIRQMENGKRTIGEKIAKRLGKVLNTPFEVFLPE